MADVLKDASAQNARGLALRRMPKELLAFNSQFHPAPATYDRVTAFSVSDPRLSGAAAPEALARPVAPTAPGEVPPPPPEARARGERIGVIVCCTAPFNAAKVVAGFGADATPEAIHGKPAHVLGEFALCVLDDRTVLLGDRGAVTQALAPRPAGAAHPLQFALDAAAKGHALAFGARVPEGVFSADPPEAARGYWAGSAKLKSVLATYDLGARPVLRSELRFPDAPTAKAALDDMAARARQAAKGYEGVKRQALDTIRGPEREKPDAPRDLREIGAATEGLAVVAGIEWLEALFESPVFAQSGDTLAAEQPVHPLLARLGTPALLYAGFSAPAVALGADPFELPSLFGGSRTSSMTDSLKQIGIAFHSYESANGNFPPAYGINRAGKRLHSWRVLLLPYLGEEKLFEKFKLDEPWDSAHNLKVVADNPMPKVYALPGVTKPAEKVTHFQVFTGPGTLFGPAGKPLRIVEIQDGVSNTVLAALAAKPVPWTRPDDIPFDPTLDMRRLVLRFDRANKPAAKGATHLLFADGAVQVFGATLTPQLMNAAITPSAGDTFAPHAPPAAPEK